MLYSLMLISLPPKTLDKGIGWERERAAAGCILADPPAGGPRVEERLAHLDPDAT
jgi:hypothetical protein